MVKSRDEKLGSFCLDGKGSSHSLPTSSRRGDRGLLLYLHLVEPLISKTRRKLAAR